MPLAPTWTTPRHAPCLGIDAAAALFLASLETPEWRGVPQASPSLSLLRKNCRDDAILWRACLPMERRQDVDLWLAYFLPKRP
jgi:hypothetical protein